MAKKGEKLLALMLVAALVLGGGNGGVIQAAEDYEVKDPVNTMADGTGITTWDCVYFGNYIQKDTNGDGKVTDEEYRLPSRFSYFYQKAVYPAICLPKEAPSRLPLPTAHAI